MSDLEKDKEVLDDKLRDVPFTPFIFDQGGLIFHPDMDVNKLDVAFPDARLKDGDLSVTYSADFYKDKSNGSEVLTLGKFLTQNGFDYVDLQVREDLAVLEFSKGVSDYEDVVNSLQAYTSALTRKVK